MKLLANRKIKTLFTGILASILTATLVSAALMAAGVPNTPLFIMASYLFMSAAILVLCFRYFKDQHAVMEDAVRQINDYLSGRREASIECSDEGELYRLFHEVNALVSILNAHVEKEKSTKRFLKDTISDISHQLKTPLAALNIYNGIILSEAEEQPSIREFARLSEQELDRIETLVQSLLKITRLDAGTVILEKTVESVPALAEKIRARFLFRAEHEGKEIRLAGEENVSLLCDRTWLLEAIGNLVKNALDHTETGDYIQISWQASPSAVRITVKDNGSGIAPEDLHHIFKRFYRSRFSKDTEGIGLGLPLTKAIVEAHGGTVETDSTPGAGAVFTMNFLIPTKM